MSLNVFACLQSISCLSYALYNSTPVSSSLSAALYDVNRGNDLIARYLHWHFHSDYVVLRSVVTHLSQERSVILRSLDRRCRPLEGDRS